MSRLFEKYQKEIIPALQETLKLANPLAVPKVIKVVINQGIGEGAQDKGVVEKAMPDLMAITGQKLSVRRARQSIAGFKLSKGAPIGLMVTLRRKRMYDFLDKLFNLVLPGVRDFRGLPLSGFDGHGNYTIGIKEQLVFPEVKFTKVEKVKGLQITIVTNAGNNDQAQKLLEFLGMPFKKS